jgi:hypothetical protein
VTVGAGLLILKVVIVLRGQKVLRTAAGCIKDNATHLGVQRIQLVQPDRYGTSFLISGLLKNNTM